MFRQLSEEQAIFALQDLLTDMHVGTPLVTEEALTQRVNEDRAYLMDVMNASGLPIEVKAQSSAVALLRAVYDGVPDVRPAIDAAVDDALVAPPPTLVIESMFVAGTLAIAVAVAIMRPRVEVVRTTSADGTRTRVVLELKGIKDLAGVLKALTGFL